MIRPSHRLLDAVQLSLEITMTHFPLVTEKLETQSRNQMIEITHFIERLVSANRVEHGFAIVYVPHTTAAITINENADKDVKHDLLQKLERLIPVSEPFYRHSEGNSDSHLKASLVGSSVTVLIENGKLVLGTWQGIQFCEFDGPRARKFIAKIVAFSLVGSV
jgi:secondary thiamine-phosphate synthase enzyme